MCEVNAHKILLVEKNASNIRWSNLLFGHSIFIHSSYVYSQHKSLPHLWIYLFVDLLTSARLILMLILNPNFKLFFIKNFAETVKNKKTKKPKNLRLKLFYIVIKMLLFDMRNSFKTLGTFKDL